MKEIEKFISADFEVEDIKNEKCLKPSNLKSINLVSSWFSIKSKKSEKTEMPDKSRISLRNSGFINDSNSQSEDNIILKNKIIKLECPTINLRSIGLEIEINFYMSGESTFYLFSRSIEDFSSEMAVCYINKELESARKFINFAIVEKFENQTYLKTLKKQEIPKQSNNLITV